MVGDCCIWVYVICPCSCCLMFWHSRMTLVSGEGGRQWLACQLEQVSYIMIHYCQGIHTCMCVLFLLYNENSSLEMLFSLGGFLVSTGRGDQLACADSCRDSYHYRGHDRRFFLFVIAVSSSLIFSPFLAILIVTILLSHHSLSFFFSVLIWCHLLTFISSCMHTNTHIEINSFGKFAKPFGYK